MSYLVKPSWIGFDGAPITGVIQPRFRLMGGSMTPTLASEVGRVYADFQKNKSVSRAEFFVADKVLADGSRVRIVANGGIEDVIVWASGSGDESGSVSALAYPAVTLPAYAPIFDRYVFDRSNPPPVLPTPAPYPAYPDLPALPDPPQIPGNFKKLWVIFQPNADGGIVKLIVLELAIDSPAAMTFEYLTTNGQVVAQSTSLLGGIVTDAGVLFTDSTGQDDLVYAIGTFPNEWAYSDLGDGVHTRAWRLGVRNFTVNSDAAASDAIVDAIRTHNAPINAAIIAASDAYQAQLSAVNAARAALVAAWEDECDQIDADNAALIQQWQALMSAYSVINATAESVTLRKTGRAAQIAAYKAWIDQGISDRHVTWAVFDAPAMTTSKTTLDVDFTQGSAPLDSAGYEDAVGYYAHYMLTRANRETVLDDGSGGGPAN